MAEGKSSNGLGLAGFILSILSICCCVTSPLALLLSLIALGKAPRGFAIAGTVLGGIGTLVLVGGLATKSQWQTPLEFMFEGGAINNFAMQYKVAHDEFPKSIQELADWKPEEFEGMSKFMDVRKDPWGNAYVIRVENAGDPDNEAHVLISPGPDGKMDTPDDCRIWQLGAEQPLDPDKWSK